jgi:hypothetical protein
MNRYAKMKPTLAIVAISSTVMLMSLGCGGSDTKKTQPSKSTGGGTSTLSNGGTIGNGGSTALTDSASADAGGGSAADGAGGSTTDGGGASAVSGGGTSTVGSSSINVAGGSSVTTLPEITCTSDINCKAANLICDKTLQKCVQCLDASGCSNGLSCIGGVCAAGPCQSNAACADSADGKVCDAVRGKCVACLTAADCPNPATSDCVAQACVAVQSCGDSRDCTTDNAPICNKTTSRCVQCVDGPDCIAAGWTNSVCASNHCQVSCTAKADCSDGKVCNTSANPAYCVECVTSSDCGQGKVCSGGTCAVSNCAGVTAKPCSTIPQFTGTQVVDAKSDDFCAIPAFELGFDNAGKVIQASGETVAATSYPERATIKVAWSANALHAFIEVSDSSVNSNTSVADIWNGDAVEIMISTTQDLHGLTSVDKNTTIHVIGNAVLGVTVSASGESASHTQISDASAYKGQTTSTGYAVELQLPWPAGTKLAASTPIYFDAALNSARRNADGTSPRNAQALLYQLSSSTSTSCTGTGDNIAPFCDDRLWCKTKTQ